MASPSRQPDYAQRRADETPRRERWARGEWWEWIAIFFAIGSLWPKILRWPSIVWDVTIAAALILMIWVFIRRARRMKESWRKD